MSRKSNQKQNKAGFTKTCRTCRAKLPLEKFFYSELTGDYRWANCAKCAAANIANEKYGSLETQELWFHRLDWLLLG
jgi:hypothetical protein